MRSLGAFTAAGLIGVGVGAYLYSKGHRVQVPYSVRRLYQKRAVLATPAAAKLGASQTGLVLEPSKYPKVHRDDTVEVLHGTSVEDPYRWLEDPDSAETQKFVDMQNAVTQEILEQCETRSKFKALLTEVFDYAKFGTPFKRGERYFYYHNTGLQQHYVLYSQATLDGEATVVIDPNTLSKDGTVALTNIAFTKDGSTMAYTLSSGGSDWVTIHVLRLDADGKVEELEDKLQYAKYTSLDWTHDGKGFFYNRYPAPVKTDLGTETESATNQVLCYHVLGTSQAEDCVIYALPEHPTWFVSAEVSDDGNYVLLDISEGCLPAHQMSVLDLTSLPRRAEDGALDFSAHDLARGKPLLPVTKLVTDFVASYAFLANDGTTFYFRTNLNAPRYRIVKVDITKAGPPTTWPEVVPQHEKDLLQSAVALKGDNMVLKYLRDVRGVVQLHSLSTGALKTELPLPGLGSVGGFSGRREDSEFFFSFVGFTEPGATYRVDIEAAEVKPVLFRRTLLKVPHNPDDYETRQVFVTSKDGTKVPMFVTYRKGLKLDGRNPTLLYAYGGFNHSLEPSFSAARLCWMRGYNGVYAQANLRGGGEYGIDWRNAGSKENKQNVFDDFQACAEFLISEGYCSSSTLAIQGGSNGGLLVAACANQRPDLYAAVLGQVGVLDMLRFHKFTIGHAWITDYGCADNEEDFKYLIKYSPLHNVRVPEGGRGQYPAMILATGDHDDRVVPLHSLKLIATLQHTLAGQPDSAQRNPLVARIEVRAGHGAGKPTDKVLQESADLYAFAAKCMNAQWQE